MTEVALLSARVTADTKGLESGLQSANQSIQSFGQSMQQGIGIGLGMTALQAVVSGVGAAFGALKSSAIDFNQTLDGAGASMSRFFTNTESLNNSIAYLNQLAAKTPFAFEGLLTAQQRTISAARSADELKSNMDAIAVAAANTGRVSTQNMGSISLALGQMQTKGKLAGGEMLQLTEAGVNMGEILAKHFGVSAAAITQMASDGKIAAQDVWAALRENAADPRNREALEKMSQTWEGAWSTIGDVGKSTIAEVFRPFFELMTQGAIQLANFLQSDGFRVWAQVVTNAFSAAAGAVRQFLAFLAPVGNMIAAAFKSLTLGAIVLDEVKDATPALQAAGADASKAVGDGMKANVSAAKGAIDELTDRIRGISRVINELSSQQNELKRTIDDVKKSFADQKQVVQEAADVAKERYASAIQSIRDQIDSIKDSHGNAADAVQKQIDRLKDDYEADINSIKDAIRGIKDEFAEAEDVVQRQIDTIKDRYGPAIDAVKARIESVKDSYAAQERSLQRHIDLVKDKYTSALDSVRSRIADITDKSDKQIGPLQKQLSLLQDANKYLRERQDAERSIANAKIQQLQLDALGDPAMRAELSGRLASLGAQQQSVDLAKQLGEAQAKLAAGGLSTEEQRSLELKIEQLRVQQQLANMVDITKLGEATKQAALLDGQTKQLSITNQLTDANRKILEIPLEEKIGKIKAATQDALEPLQSRLKSITSAQKDALDPLESKMKSIKRESQDVLVPLQSRLSRLESDQKRALDPLQQKLKDLKNEERDLLLPLQSRLRDLEFDRRNALQPLLQQLKDIKSEEKGLLEPLQGQLKDLTREAEASARDFASQLKEIDKQQKAALAPLQDQLTAIERKKQAQEEIKRGLELEKSELQDVVQGYKAAAAAAKEQAANAVTPGAPKGGLDFGLDPTAAANGEKIKQAAIAVVGGIQTAINEWIAAHPITAATLTSWAGGILDWTTEFIGKIREKAPEFLSSLGELLAAGVEWIGSHTGDLIDALGKWALEFVYWVGPKIPPLMDELGKLLLDVTNWTINVGLPALGKKLSEWGGALVEWVRPRIVPLIIEMTWLMLTLGAWVFNTAIPATLVWGIKITTSMMIGLGQGLKDAWTTTKQAFTDVVDWIITHVKSLFGIASPSTVFVEIGSSLLEGLSGGITSFWNDTLRDYLEKFGGTVIEAFSKYIGGPAQWLVEIGSNILGGVKTGWDNLWETGANGLGSIRNWFAGLGETIVNAFSAYASGPADWLITVGGQLLAGLKTGWDKVWSTGSDTVGSIRDWFAGYGGTIVETIQGWLTTGSQFLTDLLGVGGDLLMKIAEGFTAGDKIKEFKDWIKTNFVNNLPNWLKELLDIHSPSGLMIPIGGALVDGIIAGMEDRVPMLKKILKSIRGFMGDGEDSGDVPGELNDWLGAASSIAGVGEDWLDGLRWLAMHESTGNPKAVNPEDVGNGEHAMGLMQTIPSTFAAYRDHDLPNDIFNPIANAVAAINYIKRRYGSVREVIDGWHERGGYAKGGILPENMTAIGPTGNVYQLHGGEGVFNREQMANLAPIGSRGGSNTIVNVNITVGSVLASKEAIADAVVVGLQHAQRTGRTKVTVI